VAGRKKSNANLGDSTQELRPAITPEAQEARMISLTVSLAEKQLMEGTASSQVMTHYLKLAASKERDRLELEKLKEENRLLRAKTESFESSKRIEELYSEAIRAMQIYQGVSHHDSDVQ